MREASKSLNYGVNGGDFTTNSEGRKILRGARLFEKALAAYIETRDRGDINHNVAGERGFFSQG